MNKSGYIVGVIVFVTLSFSSVNALRCFKCSTDSPNSEFCRDPFDLQRVPDYLGYQQLSNCSYPNNFYEPHQLQKRPACKKVVFEAYGRQVISRSCIWVDINEPVDKCFYDSNAVARIKFCETCSTDGCNGANGIIPIASIFLIPALVAKILMI